MVQQNVVTVAFVHRANNNIKTWRQHRTLREDVQVFAFLDGLGVDVGAVVGRPSLLVVDGEG